jgi:hypothetical protein
MDEEAIAHVGPQRHMKRKKKKKKKKKKRRSTQLISTMISETEVVTLLIPKPAMGKI